uniref:programmed cell death 6-interacting protein-like n=1 Tax=Ciona intestinalis TaxID=7719 RepID=UPI000180C95F|nr:programmed cell death 6-interacting protein-like [Ciona intestinalis]|eukprot:XP_002123877.1 programmed cell death 6-interacting protein-like [Ciona intestinalis]
MSYEVELSRFFNIPIKRSHDVDFVKPLETFIKVTFDKTDDDLKKHIKEFNTLRKNAVTKPLDKSATSLNLLMQYHDQLVAASRKFPFREANGVIVNFTWKDSLQKGKFLSSTPKLSIADGDFERLCILYNIAALMSQVGSEANLQTDDGLKSAAKYFQEAAGILTFIKERVMSVVGNNSITSDLAPEVLNLYRCVLLGQAQECFYDKACTDASLNRKPEVLAKVAMQASYLYSEASKAFTEAESSYSLAGVQAMCGAKKELFECYAQYHQATAAQEGKRFGEAIARYQIVEPMARNLHKNASEYLVNFKGKQFIEMVSTIRGTTEKDNNFIYNDVVPKTSSLSPIGKAPIAKAKAFNEKENLGAKFTDMFSSLVPLDVHNALEAYEGRRKELVEKEVERIRELNNLVNGVMSSFNLPAALEDMSGSDLPPSILEKSRTVIQKGGSAPIDQLLQDLPESLNRNQQILTECVRILNDEQSSDAELREKFGDKWRRKPSAELTVPLRQEMSKYQTIIENAQKADAIIRGKYEDNKEGISLLCLPPDQLKNAIPSSSPVAALKGHPVVQELKQLCEQVNTLKAEREVMETELRSASYDMTDKFMRVLAEEGCINEESISPGELDRIYQPLIEQVNDSSGRQESVLANLQRANEQFAVLKSGGGQNKREDVLKKISAAFDRYEELTAHLREGNKFYNDLTELLLKLQPKCSDFVFARKTEKEELLKDVQQTIVGTPASTAPNVPAYHQQQDVYAEVKKPPARPPPPTAPATQAPPTAPQQTQVPKPAPRKSPAPAPPTPNAPAAQGPPASAPGAPGAPGAQGPPGQPYAHQQPPYGYPGGAPPQQGYAPFPGYGAPPAAAPYPQQPPYGYPPQPGYAPQGYGAYPPQPGYPTQPGGYPQQPQQPPQNYGNYGQQPPYYYPPQ